MNASLWMSFIPFRPTFSGVLHDTFSAHALAFTDFACSLGNVLDWLGSGVTWKIPLSWTTVYGPPPDDTMFC